MSTFNYKIGEWSDNLATLIESGLSIPMALDSLVAATSSRSLKRVTKSCLRKINEGKSLGQALREQRIRFPELLMNAVTLGEGTGQICELLRFCANYIKAEEDHKQRARGILANAIARIFGAVILPIVATIVLSELVFSKAEIFPKGANHKVDLLGLGFTGYQGLQDFLFLVFGFGFGGYFIYVLMEYMAKRSLILSRLFFMIPLLGTVKRTKLIYTLTAGFWIVVKTGSPPTIGFPLALKIPDWHCLTRKEREFLNLLSSQNLSAAFMSLKVLPTDYLNSIKLGEISGTLEKSLANLTKKYASQMGQDFERIEKVVTITYTLMVKLLPFLLLARLLYSILIRK